MRARAAVLEDRLDHGPVLLGQLAGALGRLRIVDRLDLHVQGAFVPDGAGAHPGPADAADHERERAVGQLAGVLDLGDRADLRVPAVDAGHEHQAAAGLLGGGAGALRLVGLERDRHDHLREHNALREREHRKQLGARVRSADWPEVVSNSVVSLSVIVVPSLVVRDLSGNTQPTTGSARRFPTGRVRFRGGRH